jgi:cysteinyl-tRNA synthetase
MRTAAIAALFCFNLALAAAAEPPRRMALGDVRTFMYQIDGLDRPGAIDHLAQTDYDLIVVEPTLTIRDQAKFDAAGMVARLRAGKPGRIVLAYVDVGQAERFRAYWQKDWRPPAKGRKGEPDFILTTDPDGWSDDYPVAFWDKRWQELFATAEGSELRQIMNAGFDGIYLDWIDGYEEEAVVAEAKRQKIEPAKAIVDWIATLRATARQVNPNALVVAQNGVYLIDREARFADVIDGIGFEDTWFSGKANTRWGKPKGGDIANRYKDESSTARRIEQYQKYRKAGKPVFTIDYCLKPENAKHVYEASRAAGFVPLVTQVSLSRVTETPPPSKQAGGGS